jgi:hypothetical protein
MVYLGAVFPMPWNARLGLEYNYGSKYWFNFTGAEDSVVGSKLAVRGHVYEGYWHQPIFNDNFFATIGLRYYDYEYTGSGNPMGEPVKIDDLSSLDALNPVIDEGHGRLHQPDLSVLSTTRPFQPKRHGI